jgi:hypothetical protein
MEFKFAVWQPGSNAARKRAVFHDLVHLAADQSGRRAELYCVRTAVSEVSADDYLSGVMGTQSTGGAN